MKGKKDRQLIVVRGITDWPLMLATNQLGTCYQTVFMLVKAYLARWACEEATRFIKQAFQLENVRALKFRGIQRLAFFAQTAFGFLARFWAVSRPIVEAGLCETKFFGPLPRFPYYRVAASIAFLLQKFSRKRKPPLLEPTISVS